MIFPSTDGLSAEMDILDLFPVRYPRTSLASMLKNKFTPFPDLTTERIKLRQLVAADKQAIFELRSDSEINKYLDRRACHSVEEASIFINKVNENIRHNSSLYWGISLRDKMEVVGTICLFDFSETRKCEIGYELSARYQGLGIMKEAAEAVIDYAFKRIRIQRIEAVTHRANVKSTRLLAKLSFVPANKCDGQDPDLLRFFFGS